jgi:hypothetical protein
VPQDSNNPLEDIVPVNQRRRVYAAFWLVGLALGCLTVAFATTGGDVPKWDEIANAVYVFLGVPFGALAQANAKAP